MLAREGNPLPVEIIFEGRDCVALRVAVVRHGHPAEIERGAAGVSCPSDGSHERKDRLGKGQLEARGGTERVGCQPSVAKDQAARNDLPLVIAREERPVRIGRGEALHSVPPRATLPTFPLGRHQRGVHRLQANPICRASASSPGSGSLRLPGAPSDLLLAAARKELFVVFARKIEAKGGRVSPVRSLNVAVSLGSQHAFGGHGVFVVPVGHHPELRDAFRARRAPEAFEDGPQILDSFDDRSALDRRPRQAKARHTTAKEQRGSRNARAIGDDHQGRSDVSSRASHGAPCARL